MVAESLKGKPSSLVSLNFAAATGRALHQRQINCVSYVCAVPDCASATHVACRAAMSQTFQRNGGQLTVHSGRPAGIRCQAMVAQEALYSTRISAVQKQADARQTLTRILRLSDGPWWPDPPPQGNGHDFQHIGLSGQLDCPSGAEPETSAIVARWIPASDHIGRCLEQTPRSGPDCPAIWSHLLNSKWCRHHLMSHTPA